MRNSGYEATRSRERDWPAAPGGSHLKRVDRVSGQAAFDANLDRASGFLIQKTWFNHSIGDCDLLPLGDRCAVTGA